MRTSRSRLSDTDRHFMPRHPPRLRLDRLREIGTDDAAFLADQIETAERVLKKRD